MITKIGTAKDLKDLYYQYMSFLTMGTTGSDRVNPWLIIDPRLDTFFGATIVVPMGEYETCTDEAKIWVDNSDNLFSQDQFTNFYDDPYMHNGEYNNLVKTLEHCYPNGIVEKVITSSDRPIEDMYRLLQVTPISDLPNIVISFGLFGTLHANSDNWDSYVNIELNNLFTFCNNNDIKLFCCVAPMQSDNAYYDSLFNDIESFISNTGERLINLPSKFVDMFGSISNLFSQYGNYGYSYNYQGTLVRRLLQEFGGISRYEYFVSFQYNNITGSSYRNFLYNYDDYQSEEFDKSEIGRRSIESKDNAKNPFKVSGQFVATGLHTSYDHNLWMCEQGDITCKKEADAQIEDLDMLQFYQFSGGSPQKPRDIVVYPSTGCPWLTIANSDISKYSVSNNNPINYYFTKTNEGSTLTIRICDINFTYPDCWQNMVFGRFTHMKDIIYPLYVGGGSLALYPDYWNHYANDHIYGQQYHLSMKNPALANSNILHTTKFGDANLSNFRVMTPDGFWRDIYSAYQEYKDIHYFTLAGFVPEWGECVLPHTYNYGLSTGAELVDTRNKIGLLDFFKDSNNLNKAYDKYFEKTNLDEISVQINASTEDDIGFSIGVIPSIYASWSRNLEQGLHSSDGRYWLAIPNGWQDRLWHYKFYYGRIYWEGKNEKSEWGITPRGLEQLEYVRDEYHILTEGRYNQKMINDRLVIDFGKSPIECSDLVLNFPSDYPNEDDVGLLLRVLIHAESDRILFNLYPNIDSIYVDFGDGVSQKFTRNSQIYHDYITTGDYYINIYIIGADNYEGSLEYLCSDYDTGFIYSNGRRNNVLKKLYLSPWYPDSIKYSNTVTSNDSSIVYNANCYIMYIYNQVSLEELYLPYLIKDMSNFISDIGANTWAGWFSLIGCSNIRNIYIFNDFVKDYSTIRDKRISTCLYVSNTNSDVNVYVSDMYSSVTINNSSLHSYYMSEKIQKNSSITNVELPVVDLYLHNKELVKLGNDAFSNLQYKKSKINLHVPNLLLNEYQSVYNSDQDILSIVGDIL